MEKIILEGVVGSHAYGLAGPDSDIDTAGIFVVPTDIVLGVRPYDESIVRQGKANKDEEPDKSHHEVGKFVRLAMKANPTVLEQMFLDEYTVLTQEGQLLVDNRHLFLSQLIRVTHIGYARKQLKRFKDRTGNFSSDTKRRTAKHARHVHRLVLQARKALTTGEFQIRLTEEEAVEAFAMGEMAVNAPQEFLDTAETMFYDLDQLTSRLPEEPDVDGINQLLIKIRRMN